MLIRNFLNAELQEECIHEGRGLCLHKKIISKEDVQTPLRFLNYTIIPEGASFGPHTHGMDNEFYILLSGRGVYTQDGRSQPVGPGDIMVNAPHSMHGIENTGKEAMRLLVFEVRGQEQPR